MVANGHCRSGTSEIDQSRGLSLRSRKGLVFDGFSVILSPAVFWAKWQNPSRHTSRSHRRRLNDTQGGISHTGDRSHPRNGMRPARITLDVVARPSI